MGHKNRPLPPHLAGGLGRRHNSFSIVSNLITLPPVQCNTTLCNAALWGKGLSSDAIMATYCQPGTRLPRVDFQSSWEFILFISIENENQHVWEVGDFNNTQGGWPKTQRLEWRVSFLAQLLYLITILTVSYLESWQFKHLGPIHHKLLSSNDSVAHWRSLKQNRVSRKSVKMGATEAGYKWSSLLFAPSPPME